VSPRAAKLPASRAGEAMILFAVAGHTFAIAASAVEEIRSLDGMQPLSGSLVAPRSKKFRYVLERGQRTCFVLDAAAHFRLAGSKPSRLLLLRNVPAGVLVDSIDRMAEIAAVKPLPRAFHGDERCWYRGLALIGERAVPVVDPAAFLSKPDLAMLRAGALRRVQEASA
jgi:chemotaxis signal transduction protein